MSLQQELLKMADGQISRDHLISTYYDTDNLYLSKQGLGLRMRQVNEHYLQTVKTSGSVKNGLHQREEWEHELEGPTWDLASLKLTPLVTMIDDSKLWSSLTPLFTTDFWRETLQLTLAEGTQVELAYDRGEVTAGGFSTAIHEIELELKAGDSQQLSVLATTLSQQLPISPSDISKAQMGYELVAKARDV